MLEERIELRFSLEDLTLPIYCDHAQLETALMNLVLNNRDAILRSGQGSRIEIRARPVLAANQALEDAQSEKPSDAPVDGEAYRFVEIAVSDNGPGMDAETLSRSTDPFFTTKNSNSGTGLGLSMVYGFVRQSNGDLRLYSEVDVGTTVLMTLPRGSASGEREDPMPTTRIEQGNGETILLVEDETSLLEMMTDLLKDLNYHVTTAMSGSEALEMIEDGEPFDLRLTDIVMPGGIGGFELASRVRVKIPDVPIIYTSGYSGFNVKDMGAAEAVLLQKPAAPTELAASISLALKTNTGANI